MKTSLKPALFLAICCPAFTSYAADPIPLETPEAQAGYAIGTNIGSGLKRDGVTVDLDALIAGIRDAFSGAEARLTAGQRDAAMAELQKSMAANAGARGERAKLAGDAYLAENKTKEGVTTLPSGLQYKVLTAGEGNTPKATDTVSVHYKGTLTDGTVFDSSYDRGEPATFPVDGVIAGWTEALKLMPEGSKWELTIPSDLAYGESGAGEVIPPNSVLVFQVELLEINNG
jgi:FKBP-type peptidyl-prolyl cis-trans isomerase FklB